MDESGLTEGVRSSYALLGAVLLDAGLSVTDVRVALEQVQAGRGGEPELTFAVLAGLVLVGLKGRPVPAVMASPVRELSTRRAADANKLLRAMERGELGWDAAEGRIAEIRREPPGHPALSWILGSALVAVGLAILFRCPGGRWRCRRQPD